MPDDELLFIVSEPEALPFADDVVSLLEFEPYVDVLVPLAPMLVVLLLSELLAVLLDEPLGDALDVPVARDAPIVALSCVLLPVLAALGADTPALLLEPLVPLVCAMAMPPTARAAAAASVVSVFLVVLMSCSP
jgi:hypothetical protein